MNVTLLGVFVISTQLGAPSDTVRLDGLDRTLPGEPVPYGWQLRAVNGARPPAAGMVWYADRPALMLTAAGAAGQSWLELEDPLEPRGGELRWRWRVAAHVPGADLRDPERDDAPGRVFVAFGRPGLFSRPRMIFYTWGGPEARGDAFLSHVSDRLAVVVVRNAADRAGAWLQEVRDVVADYRKAFDEEPDEITSVGLMIDTDQTGAWASVQLSELVWVVRRSTDP
jgi:hypothetical protein